MALRMMRSTTSERPEPLRKRRRYNDPALNSTMDFLNDGDEDRDRDRDKDRDEEIDNDRIEKFNKTAGISIDRSLTADEKRVEMGKAFLQAAEKSLNVHMEMNGIKKDQQDTELFLEQDMIMDEETKEDLIHKKMLMDMKQKEGKYRYQYGEKLKKILENYEISAAAAATATTTTTTTTLPIENPIKIKSLRGHRLAVTCLAIDPIHERYVITGSKDGSIIKWDLQSGKKVYKVWHAWPLPKSKHMSSQVRRNLRPQPVLAIAISPDGKYLVSGGEDCLIRVWLVDKMAFKSTFRGHRGSVTGLAFSTELKSGGEADVIDSWNENSNNASTMNITLFSVSSDRQIRVYDMKELGFAEPLYGHTLSINNISSTSDDRCITVSDDGTIRYWRLKTQSQLIFRNGHGGNFIDCCAIIDPVKFITGGTQDSSIVLWSSNKKNPLFRMENTHTSKNGEIKHWITCLAAKPNSDVFASGASDGVVRLWHVGGSSFQHIRSIRVPKGGFINAMEWNKKGDILICAIGNEHRLGRWDRVASVRNGICAIKLPIGIAEIETNENTKQLFTFGNMDSIHWDRWSPLEKGFDENYLKKTNQELQSSQKTKEQAQLPDEWSNFFGKVFGDN